MFEGAVPGHGFLGDAVELDTPLHTIASVDNSVRIGGAEASQAWGEQFILTL